MVQAVFCTASTGDQVEAAINKTKASGIDATSLTLYSSITEFDSIACPQMVLNQSLKRGTIWGFVIGWLLGMALLVFIPSLQIGWGAWSIPAFQALGWSLFGMIVGSGGLLAKNPISSKLRKHLEEAMTEGKVLLTLKTDAREEIAQLAQVLGQLGETDLHEIPA